MLSARPIAAYEFSGITMVSLLCKTEPNLGDHTQTRNAENANENGHKKTELNLGEKLRQDCKTFIHRFDSDRRLHLESITYRRSISSPYELFQQEPLFIGSIRLSHSIKSTTYGHLG